MKDIIKILIVSMVVCVSASSQTHLFVNPGIKVGYVFGENGGFVFGYELSAVVYTQQNQHSLYGLVIDYDWPKGIKRLHIGIEYIHRGVGVDIGPTFGWDENSTLHGLSVIPFGNDLPLVYYHYNYWFSIEDYHDAGTYVKIPIGEIR